MNGNPTVSFQGAEETIGPVHEAALVRQVPPAEELTESATEAPVGKVPSVEGARRVRHQSISRGRLEPGMKQEGFRVPSLKNS